MIASIKDKEAWILEREEEFSENLYGVSFPALGKTLQALVYRWAERDYNDTLADYA